MLYLTLTAGVLLLHLLFILWVMFGALLTRNRPVLGWFHISSLVYGASIEIWDCTCPLTPLEDWFRVRAGLSPYQSGFLLHYLDMLVYPDVPPSLLTICGVVVCLFNLGIYGVRYWRAKRK
jgi:hypothetical protein